MVVAIGHEVKERTIQIASFIKEQKRPVGAPAAGLIMDVKITEIVSLTPMGVCKVYFINPVGCGSISTAS